jgi:hypothetical protein
MLFLSLLEITLRKFVRSTYRSIAPSTSLSCEVQRPWTVVDLKPLEIHERKVVVLTSINASTNATKSGTKKDEYCDHPNIYLRTMPTK